MSGVQSSENNTNNLCKKSDVGKIDIIMGCMFSGKSTELIRLVNRYKILEKNMLIINIHIMAIHHLKV